MKSIFRLRQGSVQSKVISLLIPASIILTPLTTVYAAFGDGTPTVQNASLFGETDLPKIDGASGAFTQHVQLDIPPGRNGLQPDVALDYSSQNTKDGIVGYGWSLSIPYIERLNKTGSQDLYGSNVVFTSSLDGELVGSTTRSIASSTAKLSVESNTYGPASTAMCSGVSSVTLSKTVSASSTLLIVHTDPSDNFITSITYAGVSMTLANSTAGISTWYLVNPTSGTNNVVVNFTTSVGGYVSAVSYTGTDTSNPLGVIASNTGGSGDASVSISTNDDNSIVDDQLFYDTNQSTVTPNSPQVKQLQGTCSGFAHGASTLQTSTHGSNTLGWTHGGASSDWIEIAAEVRAAPSTITTPTSNSQYMAKVDEGPYNSYSFSTTTNTWTMYDKKGTKYTFGSADSGRMYDTGTGSSTNTYRWMLQEIRDTNGNYIAYSYLRDNNVLYPYKITYTGNGSTDGPFTITFATSTRPDTRTSYATGFGSTLTQRISEIDALVNGTTTRKYLLGYGTGENGYRSLLTSVQQQGYDDNGNLTSLPAMTFSYASSTTQFYSQNAIHQVNGQRWVIADTNGDGINDVNSFWHNDFTNQTVESMALGNSTQVDNSFGVPDSWANGSTNVYPNEKGVRYLDLNADGKADVVKGFQNVGTGHESIDQTLSVNAYTTGGGYSWSGAATTSTTIPIFALETGGGLILSGGVFGDVNGDGLPDYETSLPGGFINASAYLGNGYAWSPATTTIFYPAKDFPVSTPSNTASQLVDINGDGLDDWVYGDSSNTYVLLNKGTGWDTSPASQWTIATSTLYKDPNSTTYYDRGIRFVDMNGDGLPDFVRGYDVNVDTGCNDNSHGEPGTAYIVYLNTGNGWASSSPSTAYSIPNIYYDHDSASAGCTWDNFPTYNEMGNWTGNGQMNQDVMTKVTNPKGGSTSVTYSVYTNQDLPYAILVASGAGVNDGRGNTATTTYSYSGGKQYTALGVRDRKFAGFSSATTTAPDSAMGTYYDQGDSIDTSHGEQSDGYAQINHPYRKDVFDLSNNLKQRTYYRWDTIAHGSSTFVALGRLLVEDFASDGSHRDKATAYTYSSSTDDLLNANEYGEVTGNSDGTYSDIGTDLRSTNYSYVASSSVNMSLPTRKTILDYNSATTTDQKLYYDSLAYGSVAVGNNTKQDDWVNGTSYASLTKTYNIYGLVATSTDRNGNATSFVYDANNLYVATTTNALSQTTNFLYNYANGKARWKSDPNSSLTKNVYDGLGRLTEVDVSSTSTPTTYATTTTFIYVDSTSTPYLKRSDWLVPSTMVDSYQYFDGLNRVFQERKQSPTANTFAVTDRVYNPAGLLGSTTLPYFSSGASSTSATSTSALFTTYTYDAFQRPLTIANAVGMISNSYSKWITTTVDPDRNVKDYWMDAFGNLAKVVEYRLTTGTSTTTANSVSVESNSYGPTSATLCSAATSLTFSKSVSATSTLLIVHTDPDQNFITSIKYAGVDMTRAVSASGIATWYLIKPTSGTNNVVINFSTSVGGGYASAVSYTGSDTTNPVGATSTNSGGSGNPSLSITTNYDNSIVDDHLFYDAPGQSVTANSPQVQQVAVQCSGDSHGASTLQTTTHGVQSLGWTHGGASSDWIEIAVEVKPSSTSVVDATTLYAYDALNNLASTTDSSGNVRHFTYDGLSRRLSAEDLHAPSDATFGTWTYSYDDQGNMASQTDPKGQVVNRTYDALNRMTTEDYTGQAGTELRFVYDSCANGIGYLCSASSTSATSTNAYDILGRIVSATTSILGNKYNMQYQYDRQGNVTSWTYPNGSQVAVSYNSAGLPSKVQRKPSGGAFSDIVTSFDYSPTGQVTTTVFGSGASTTRTYDSNAIYRLSQLQTRGKNGSKIQDYAYTYDAVGNLTQVSNGAISTLDYATTTYTYDTVNRLLTASTTAASSTPYSQTFTYDALGNLLTFLSGTTNSYGYSQTGDANPDAVTTIGNGTASTTYSYDNNGNLISAGNGTATTTYTYDYANRLTAIFANNSTTSFGYDAFGARVYQIASTTATSTYPFKWFSIASTTRGSTNYATSTEYIFNGDTLLSTVDQAFKNGAATGTAAVRYVHPDHLGSTEVVTDANQNLVQTLDYYPYGATRISNSTSTNEKRKYIGQFSDDSGLSYLNARYYNPNQGQFISQDPVFWEVGLTQDGKSALSNPQALNSYGYANDNPIRSKDPAGRCAVCAGIEVAYSLTAQATYDSAFGRSSPAVYGGDIVGGAIYGFAYRYTIGFPEPVAAISAAAGNVAQQGFEYLSGDRKSFDSSQVQTAATVAFGTQLAVGSLPIPILSGSALSKQIATKLQREMISNVSNATLSKIGISNAPGSLVGNFTATFAQSRFNSVNLNTVKGISSALSGSPSVSQTISLAKAAIQLAQSVIASYQK
jgi:RHS repeat-associated protein